MVPGGKSMPCLPKEVSTVQSSTSSSSTRAEQGSVHATCLMQEGISLNRILYRLGGVKVCIGLNIRVLLKVQFRECSDRDLSGA